MALQTDTSTLECPTPTEHVCWVNTFLDQQQNSFFCRVNDSFLGDKFELYELDGSITHYRLALNLLRNRNISNFYELSKQRQEEVTKDAHILYGLIHSRFIITKHGLHKMRDKFYTNAFGVCYRHQCCQQPLLPIGITHEIDTETVRLYCANCDDIYIPQNKYHRNVDGAYFGTTFAHLFLLSFPTLKPKQSIKRRQYIPKIFGFKVHDVWHQVALETLEGTYCHTSMANELNKDSDDEKESLYLKSVNEKQNNEILRLDAIIKKIKIQMKKTKLMNKRQKIKLLSAQTTINALEQINASHNSTKNAVLAEVQFAPLPKKAINDVGFKDILDELKKRSDLIKNKYEKNRSQETNNNDLQLYEMELNEICKVSNAFRSYVNTLQNGI